MCMCACIRLERSGDMVPQEMFWKLDAMRLLLRPFCDRIRAVVVDTWAAEYCIQFLVVHVCI